MSKHATLKKEYLAVRTSRTPPRDMDRGTNGCWLLARLRAGTRHDRAYKQSRDEKSDMKWECASVSKGVNGVGKWRGVNGCL